MKAVIQANYNQVKQDVISIVDMEIQRIRRDPAFAPSPPQQVDTAIS